MTKSKRMESVKRVMHNREMKAAKVMEQSRQSTEAASQQLQALRDYLQEYQIRFQQLSLDGVSVSILRDYQSFISRLRLAIVEQEGIVQGKQHQQQSDRKQWQQKHIKTSVVGHMVKRLKNKELHNEERLAQKVLDEANSRRFHRNTP